MIGKKILDLGMTTDMIQQENRILGKDQDEIEVKWESEEESKAKTAIYKHIHKELIPKLIKEFDFEICKRKLKYDFNNIVKDVERKFIDKFNEMVTETNIKGSLETNIDKILCYIVKLTASEKQYKASEYYVYLFSYSLCTFFVLGGYDQELQNIAYDDYKILLRKFIKKSVIKNILKKKSK